jgi:hypothetical protein
MEGKMLNQINQKIIDGPTIDLDQNKVRAFSSRKDSMEINPDRYLRSWGNDYPYLDYYPNYLQCCLPIPENSEAQRFIRSLAGYTHVK